MRFANSKQISIFTDLMYTANVYKTYYTHKTQQVKQGGRIIQLNELNKYDNILIEKKNTINNK